MIALDTSIEELNQFGLLSTRTMNVCRTGGITTLKKILNIDKLELLKIRNCGSKTINELELIRRKYKDIVIEDSTDNNADVENSVLDVAKLKYEHLQPSITVNLESWLRWRFSKLSVRAKNAFPKLSGVLEVINKVYSSEELDLLSVKKCGEKTIAEIKSFLVEFKQHFEEATKDIDVTSELPEISRREKEIVELGMTYPFLLTKECELIADFILQNKGSFPYLYVAKRYISRTENPKISICRDYYGLNTTFTRYTLSELGEKNNLTRERVRQIIKRSIPLPKQILESVRHYLDPLIKNVVPFDSPLWKKIQWENMLVESYTQTALLVSALLDTHMILQIEDEDMEYLVRSSIVENVKIRNVLKNIIRVIELRRTTIEYLDILQYITSDNKTYHKDVGQLCVIYANFLKRKYSVEIEDNHIIVMHPNTFDISIAIEKILEKRGEPMSLEELFDGFNQLYPTYAIDTPLKLKPYIYRNRNIKPKSKTGIYVLKKWKNHYTGTLTSYLEYILRSFDEPMALDDLVDFALEEFPKTNKKSIYSLIVMDKNARFVTYEGGYVGLCSNTVSDFGIKGHKMMKRQTFDSRFADFKTFVITMQRFPFKTGVDEEQLLARWLENVLESKIDSTEEQLSSLHTFIDENKELPQNGFDYKFKQMCDKIKVIVNQTFELPKVADNQSEYLWLRRNRGVYTSYVDNRKTYFEDLLSYLKDFGYYI